MQQLQGEKGFVLETTHTTPAGESTSPLSRLLALEGLRTMRGLRLAVNFGPDSEPRSIEVSGQANLTAYDDRSGGAPSSIAARTLSFDLTNGSISHASAVGDVDLQGAPSEGEPEGFQLQSEELNAAFDPNIGSILRIEGQGAIQLTNRDMTSRGSSTFLDPNTDVVTLAGDKDQPAHAEWLDRKIQADLIQADRKGNNLAAEGNVRTSYQPPESRQARAQNQALPFFRRGETIYAMAGSLVFSDGGQIAHYRDRVRLWQGENRLEAMEVDLSEIEGTVDARGDVVSTFRQSVPKGSPRGGTPSDEIVTIDAAWMKYDRDRHVIMYGDRVLLTQGSLRVACERLSVLLKPDGRTADKLDARGSVELHDINRIGRGDRLVANVDADTMVLTGIGREAVIQDATGQQVVRGSSLTMERSSDRIMVESELGGRTWIILKPRQKGAPGVASDPKN
ncbi:MAG: LptA/OstA family protein [Acidobacteriota bacterium]